MARLTSWRPINFDRWTAIAYATQEADVGAHNDLMLALPSLRMTWERLRDDIHNLFQPAGPPGTHAHEHYHPPFEPDEHERVLTACATDYASALLFLDIALDATARGVGAAAGLQVDNWIALVKLAEAGDDRIGDRLASRVLYLQRTVLYARNKAVAHPSGELTTVSHDNVGNVIFWRLTTRAEPTLLVQADELLHTLRPEIDANVHVGPDIPPHLAATWIASRAADLTARDRQLFERVRAGLGYWLPGPYEIADNVNAAIDELAKLLPEHGFGAIALRAIETSASIEPPVDASDEVGAKPDDPNAGMAEISRAVALGEAGELAEAAVALKATVARHPDSAVGHLALAETLHNMERYGEAIQHYRLARAIGLPDSGLRDGLADSHFNLAAAAYNSGDLTTAAEHYRAVVRLQPKSGIAHGRLAVALARQGHVDAARLEAELAVTRHGDQPEVRLDVGLALLGTGNADAALEQFTVASDLRDGWTTAEIYRGVALAELGRITEARESLSAALAAEPGNRLAQATLDAVNGD
jgi:tetratricopeptide (TPR) repeat protein